MIRKLVYIEMPADTDIKLLSEELQTDIASVSPKWVGDMCADMRVVDGKKVIRPRVTTDATTIKALIAKHELPWRNLGMRSCKKEPAFDANGHPVLIDEGLETEHQLYEHVYDTPFDVVELQRYLTPTTDEEGNETIRPLGCPVYKGSSDDLVTLDAYG